MRAGDGGSGRYRFLVFGGNNSALIREAMLRRDWWEVRAHPPATRLRFIHSCPGARTVPLCGFSIFYHRLSAPRFVRCTALSSARVCRWSRRSLAKGIGAVLSLVVPGSGLCELACQHTTPWGSDGGLSVVGCGVGVLTPLPNQNVVDGHDDEMFGPETELEPESIWYRKRRNDILHARHLQEAVFEAQVDGGLGLEVSLTVASATPLTAGVNCGCVFPPSRRSSTSCGIARWA